MSNFWRRFALFLLSASASSPALAQTRSQVYGDALTKQAQTIYVKACTGMTTFESEAAESKETRSTTSYELGGWFGEARMVGLRVSSREDVVPFSLNSSETTQNFTDVRLAGRLWWFTPSVGVSLSEVDISEAGTKKVGLFGTGINTGLGLNVGVYPGVVVSADLMSVRSNHVYDKLSASSSLKNRTELDGNISFDLTERVLDLVVGYNVRTYEVATSDSSFTEKSQGAYAGIRTGVYF